MQNNPFAALTGNLNNSNSAGTSAVGILQQKKLGNSKTSVFDMAKGGNQNNKMALMLKDKIQTKILE